MDPRNTDQEIWKLMPGTTTEFSNLGRVRNAETLKLKKISKGTGDYSIVQININGKSVSQKVHRCVLISFDGPCPIGLQGSHLNGIKTDNRLKNLIWETSKQNNHRRLNHGTLHFGEKHHRHKLSIGAVNYIVKNRHIDTSELAEKFGVSKSAVGRVKSGRAWRHLAATPRLWEIAKEAHLKLSELDLLSDTTYKAIANAVAHEVRRQERFLK